MGFLIVNMPPKPKLTKDDIIDVAFNHVRNHGWDGLTARFISKQLNTSTKPIYFHFSSMQAIEETVVKKALDTIHGYTAFPRTNDPWIDQALKVVIFAVDEKYLWRAMNDENHVPFRRKYGIKLWRKLAEELSNYPPFQGISKNKIEMIRRTRWIFIHGYASLLNNIEWSMDREKEVIQTIIRVSTAICNELKKDPDIVVGKPIDISKV